MLSNFKLKSKVATCDISHGIPSNCNKCPIARRVFIDLSSRFRRWDKLKVAVDGSTVDVTFKDARGVKHAFVADMPQKGQDFIGEFDELKRVRKGNKLRVDPKQDGAPRPFRIELAFENNDDSLGY